MPQIPTLFPYTTLFRSPRARSSIPGNLSYEKKEQKQNQRRSEGVKGKHQGEDWPRNSQPEHGGRRAPGTRWRQAPTQGRPDRRGAGRRLARGEPGPLPFELLEPRRAFGRAFIVTKAAPRWAVLRTSLLLARLYYLQHK